MIQRLFSVFAVVAFVTINLSAFAQSKSEIDSRLSSKFSKKELKSLSQSELDYWTFYLDNSILIVDIPKEKPDAVPASIKLPSMDLKELNIFKLGLEPHEYARDYLRIEGTNKMVVVLPMTEITENYKTSKK